MQQKQNLNWGGAVGLSLVVNSIGRRNETLSPTSIIELNTKSEIPIRNKVTNFQKTEMMAAKKNKFTINLKSPPILKKKSL